MEYREFTQEERDVLVTALEELRDRVSSEEPRDERQLDVVSDLMARLGGR